MTRPVVTVSVDVDPVDLHLDGYGWRGLEPDPLAYTTALPRLHELFARTGVRATLFVVGRDGVAHADALRSMVAEGHEVASHSATHPLAITRLGPDALERETAGSRATLAAACGGEVVGFRAPNFDMDVRTLAALARAGYRYDASGYPTPLLAAARLLLASKSGDPRGVLRLRLWPFDLERLPHRVGIGADVLEEFPLSVHGLLRMPVYHTPALRAAREALHRGARRAGRARPAALVPAPRGGRPGADRGPRRPAAGEASGHGPAARRQARVARGQPARHRRALRAAHLP